MKNYLTIAFFLFITLSIFGQEKGKSNVPKNYLGFWQNKHIYTTGLTFIRSNVVNLYAFEDTTLVHIETIESESERFEQLFLFNNTIYAILSDFDEKNYFLVEYNDRFLEQKRIKLMAYSDQKNQVVSTLNGNNAHVTRYFQKEGKVLFYVSENDVRLAVIDLQELKFNSYYIKTKNPNMLIPNDVLFYNISDAHVILEYYGDYSYYVLKNGEMYSFKLNKYEKGSPRKIRASSFKFLEIKDENYLMATASSDILTEKHVGFTFNQIKDLDLNELKLKVIINEKLKNQEIWCKKDYIRWKRRGIKNLCKNSVLNEIYIENDKIITTVLHEPTQYIASNIMISSLNIEDIENPFVEWTAFTHNGLGNHTNYYYKQNSYAYFTIKNDHSIKVFYNCKASSINLDGSVTKYKKEYNPKFSVLPDTRIAILNISLDNGAVSYEPYPYFNDPSYPKRIINNYYFVADEMVHFILETIPFNYEFYAIGKYTTKAVSIPYNE